MKKSQENWQGVILSLRIKARKYYNRCIFSRFNEIAFMANQIEKANKLTYQEDISQG